MDNISNSPLLTGSAVTKIVKHRYLIVFINNTNNTMVGNKVAQCLKIPLIDTSLINSTYANYLSINGQKVEERLAMNLAMGLVQTMLYTTEDNVILALDKTYKDFQQQDWLYLQQSYIQDPAVIVKFIKISSHEVTNGKQTVTKRRDILTIYDADIWDVQTWNTPTHQTISDGTQPFIYNFKIGGTIETEVNYLFEWIANNTPQIIA